jgi:Spy/CpxP family protein refolding chaperone
MEEKMKNSLKLAVIIIAVLSVMPLAAQKMGKGHSGKKGEHMMMMHDKMLEDAGVPDAKRSEIRKKGHEIHKEMMDINYSIGELRIKMKDEYEKAKPDINSLKSLNNQIAELRKKQFILMGNFKIDTFSSLTPDQRKKMLELMKDKRKKFMGRMGGRGPDPMDDDE